MTAQSLPALTDEVGGGVAKSGACRRCYNPSQIGRHLPGPTGVRGRAGLDPGGAAHAWDPALGHCPAGPPAHARRFAPTGQAGQFDM